MAWKRIAGRRFLNDETGEILSRRQYDKLVGRIETSYEAKAKANREASIEIALSRPAPGRKKARAPEVTQSRVEVYREIEREKLSRRMDRIVARESKRYTKPIKISGRTLKTGHYAERIPFADYAQYVDVLKQSQTLKAPNGKRLIVFYGLGMVGLDERTGKQRPIMVTRMMSPRLVLTRDDFEDEMMQTIEDHIYLIPLYYFIHLHFEKAYAQSRVERARKRAVKNIKGMR